MKKIQHYLLYYTPKGFGQVVFRLEGEVQDRSTDPLNPVELAALAAVLAQKRIAYNPTQKFFASYDDDNNPLTDQINFV